MAHLKTLDENPVVTLQEEPSVKTVCTKDPATKKSTFETTTITGTKPYHRSYTMSPKQDEAISTANRSAGSLESIAKKHVSRLESAVKGFEKQPIAEDRIFAAEYEVGVVEKSLEKFRVAIEFVHAVNDLSEDEIQNEKYFLSYNSLELKTTGLVRLVFQAKRYRDEEQQRRREEGQRRRDEEQRRRDEEEKRRRGELEAAAEEQRREELHKAKLAQILPAHVTNANGNKDQARAPPKFMTTLKPDTLEIDATIAQFRNFRIQFDDYYTANRMELLPIREQRAHLRSCLSSKVQETIKHLLEDALDKHYSESLKVITTLLPKFSEYLVRLRLVGDSAELKNLPYEDVLASHIVANVSNKVLQKELLKMEEHDFKSVKAKCLAWEASDRNQSSMSQPGSISTNKISSYKQDKMQKVRSRSKSRSKFEKTGESTNARSDQSSKSKSCFKCGGIYHSRDDCPAKNARCIHCGIAGHFVKVCNKKARGQKRVETITVRTHHIERHGGRSSPLATVRISTDEINWSEVNFLPDTGTGECLANDALLENLGIEYDTTQKCIISAANGSSMECLGSVEIYFSYYGFKVQSTVHVTPDVSDFLLAKHTMEDLGMIPKSFPEPFACALERLSKPVHSHKVHFVEDPTPEEVLKAKEDLLKSNPTVFNIKTLKAMRGKPMHIHMIDVEEDKKPKPCLVARPIPFAFREAARKELDAMMEKGIIKPVNEPTEFISPFLVVPKPNGSVRLVVDYKGINKFIKRPIHPFPSVSDFATLDATYGYWQIPLERESQLLTTFLTPWGRYAYLRAPMGLASSGDEYCLRGDQALCEVPNKNKVVDDILLYAKTWDELQSTLKKVMDACKKYQITLSPTKVNIGSSVHYVGMIVSGDGIKADPGKIKAICDFPSPTNITDLRSFFDLVNQLGSFVPDLAHKAAPLRPLLSTKNVWQWLPEQQAAFEAVKKILVSPPILAHFDITLPTRILTDASRLNGLGYALMQDHGSEEEESWRLVQCGSRFLTDAETRYSVGQLEALAILYGIYSCRTYLLGLQHFDVITDHKSLQATANSTNLASIDDARMQRILEKLAGYNFTVKWVAGKSHLIADALSRSPVNDPPPQDIADIVYSQVVAKPDDPALIFIREAAAKDEFYRSIVEAIPKMCQKDVKSLPPHDKLRSLVKDWDDFSLSNSLIIIHGHRIFVPLAARKEVLHRLHIAHQGITRTRARARELYYWPGLSNEVQQMVQSCDQCQRFSSQQQKEPLLSDRLTSRPFENISADLFEYAAKHFLVVVDRYSGWPMVFPHKSSPKSSQAIANFKEVFNLFGIPVKLRTDGGRQFISAEFMEFCTSLGIEATPSTTHYPQSNGHAEAAVKAMKNLVKKNWVDGRLDEDGFDRSVLEWRNTPRTEDGIAPSQWLLGRLQRTYLPAHASVYDKTSKRRMMSAEGERRKNYDKKKEHYDTRSKNLKKFQVGQEVRLRHHVSGEWNRIGIIKAVRKNGRSYEIESDGSSLLRNRRSLRPSMRTTELFTENEDSDASQCIALSRARRNAKPPHRLGY
ncbi:Uncharacterized protein FKW44_006983 [Caligus rogercresseyi]|uniref:RNA-directed DNA polymerase n=1 Tax=Caligus rogercresseyi TaxID=217165 RepID=A0A7T8KE82_CALRO|nr:Uncharacterized protein FKW44_006983 [Caligus rogercresseyi]